MVIRKKKSEKLFWVGAFWYGSVDLPETRIFFFLGLIDQLRPRPIPTNMEILNNNNYYYSVVHVIIK